MKRILCHRHKVFAGVFLGGLLVFGSATPASAQSFFDLLFGGGARRAAAPSSSYGDPRFDGRDGGNGSRGGYVGGGMAYCVRMCDGRHFPISNRGGNAAEICKSFCPASPTKVFSGGAIDNAYASDGKRYSDIPNAFVYREKLIADCTCDGKSPTGLVRQNADDDPTLRAGDVVASPKGLVAYRGESRNIAQYSPIGSAGFSPAMRSQLMATRVVPDRTPEEMKGANEAAVVSRNVDQRSQAAR